jgi:hypothetical protein
MSLIREWKQAHQITSVQIGVVIAVLGAADQWLPMVQGFIAPWMFGVLGAVGVIARLVVQPKLHARRDSDRGIK